MFLFELSLPLKARVRTVERIDLARRLWLLLKLITSMRSRPRVSQNMVQNSAGSLSVPGDFCDGIFERAS